MYHTIDLKVAEEWLTGDDHDGEMNCERHGYRSWKWLFLKAIEEDKQSSQVVMNGVINSREEEVPLNTSTAMWSKG